MLHVTIVIYERLPEEQDQKNHHMDGLIQITCKTNINSDCRITEQTRDLKGKANQHTTS